MKARNVLIIALILALSLVLGGCAGPGSKASSLETITDQGFIDRYIQDLDIALVGENELLFEDSAQIPSRTLYMFFAYAVTHDKLYDPQQWVNKADGRYHIPLDTVTTTISRYFKTVNFDPADVPNYVSASKEFVTPVFAGFGGGRFVRLRDKAILSKDTVRLTADFYDGEGFAKVVYSKVYTVQISGDGYKYLSITKE